VVYSPAVRIIPEGSLAYGLQLPIQSQSELYVADWERTCGAAELAAIAEAADRSGFHYVAVCDHVAIPRDLAGAMGTTWYDPVATLGFLAGRTERVHLLSHVYVAPLRPPLQSAKSFATLDHLSGGRVIVGVGTGHVRAEFEALGVDFTRRGRLLDEAIDVLRESLAEEFVGDLGLKPRPVQSPRPPIWVGGSSPAALQRVAERGDGWLPQGTPRDQMPGQIATIREHMERLGRDEPVDLGAITEPVYVGDADWKVGRRTLTGSGESIAESLRAYGEMGCSHLQVRFRARSLEEQLDQMERFGAEVGPLL
jgi:probable F420-dependent oxidoreductase